MNDTVIPPHCGRVAAITSRTSLQGGMRAWGTPRYWSRSAWGCGSSAASSTTSWNSTTTRWALMWKRLSRHGQGLAKRTARADWWRHSVASARKKSPEIIFLGNFYQKTGFSNSQKWGSLKNIILIFASATSYITILSNGIVFCAENSN